MSRPFTAILPIAALAVFAAALGACERETSKPTPKVIDREPEVAASPPPLRGVHPDDFQCESVATASQVSVAVGHDVVVESSSFPAPTGVPRGCNYIGVKKRGADSEPAQAAAAADAGPALAQPTWSFDVDCRKTALRDGRALIDQYAEDASSTALPLGRAAIDHRGVVLVMIDDDTPCYARVLGPDQTKRVAIAKLVLAGLSPTTAPATRRR